jgi:hypothetical protein
MLTRGNQFIASEVPDGKLSGSQTYRESFTFAFHAPAQRSPRNRYEVVELPCTPTTNADCEPKVMLLPTSASALQVPVMLVAVAYFAWFGCQPVAP